MFIPLSIDRVQSNKQRYFMTNGKMAGLGGLIIVYFILAAVLLRGSTTLLPLFLLTFMFLIMAIYYIRFVMFEEKRLKKSVKDSDNNRYVRIDHFNAIQEIRDDGLIVYQYQEGVKRAYVIRIRRGSKVGVPDGFMEQQKLVLNGFLQEIHRKGWHFDKYEMEKRPELAGSTITGLNRLRSIENDTLRNYHRLQLETMKEYTMSDSQEVVDYYVIYNRNIKTFKYFKDNLDSIVRKTLRTSPYLSNTSILDKKGLRIFLEDLLLLDSFDINDIRRNVIFKPMSEFGYVTRAIDFEGNEEIMMDDLTDSNINESTKGEGIIDTIERTERIENNKFNNKVKKYNRELERILKLKDRDKITFSEFQEKRNELFVSIFTIEDKEFMNDVELLSIYEEVFKDDNVKISDDEFDLGNEDDTKTEVKFGIDLDEDDDDFIDLDEDDEDNFIDYSYRR